MRTCGGLLRAMLLMCLGVAPAFGANVVGTVTDATGAVLPGVKIVLKDLASGQEVVAETGADGKYDVATPRTGSFLLVVSRRGFSEIARTILVTDSKQRIDMPLRLEVMKIAYDIART